MGAQLNLSARIYSFSSELAPYFSSLYSIRLKEPDQTLVRDVFSPEWSTIVLTAAGPPNKVGIVPVPRVRWSRFGVGGPATRGVDIEMRAEWCFTFSISPAGWARFVDADASTYADQLLNGHDLPPFAPFAGLMDIMADCEEQPDDTVARRINAHLLQLPPLRNPHAQLVLEIQQALLDPAIKDVGALCEHVGIGRRKMERLSSRYFGFTPKTLIRRQRFLRSLGSYMLSDSDNWSAAVDGQYVDQPHFVRDFRFFMGMTPGEYARMDHPLLDRFVGQRLADLGAASDRYLDEATGMGGSPPEN